MARLSAPVRPVNASHLVLIAFQFAVLGLISLFVLVAIVNAIFGVPELSQVQGNPYSSS